MTEAARLLIVDDEEIVRFALSEALRKRGYEVETATSAEEALARLGGSPFDVVVTDVRLPGMDGIEFVSQAKALDPDLVILVMSGVAARAQAVEAMWRGAQDYFAKPFRTDELDIVVTRALEKRALLAEVRQLRAELQRRHAFPGLVGTSGRMQQVMALIEKVLPAQVTVLLQGESGTGKERVAEIIHRNGPRKDRPLIKVNCAAIPDALLESELFGHERGAFTGAVAQRPGKFELAHGGTLFLDEVADMSLATQAKILRALESREVYRVGGTRPIRVDVRVIAATNRNVAEAVQRKEFREDLYFRLNVFAILLPPLREHPEDIPDLVEHFLREFTGLPRPIQGVTAECLERLMAYSWPGNVRELRNALERAAVVADGALIQPDDLPPHIATTPRPAQTLLAGNGDLDARLAEVERRWIVEALRDAGGVQAAAARSLGISERSLWYRIKKYQVDPDRLPPG